MPETSCCGTGAALDASAAVVANKTINAESFFTESTSPLRGSPL
jgi:hypothetical protein